MWTSLWADLCIGDEAGAPCLVGEWGGVMRDSNWKGRNIPDTSVWQAAFAAFLLNRRARPSLHPSIHPSTHPPTYPCTRLFRSIGFFYWTLNGEQPPPCA